MNNKCIRCKKLCETTFISFDYNHDPTYKFNNINVKCIRCLNCRFEYYRTMNGIPIKIRIWTILENHKTKRHYEISYRFPAFTAAGAIKNFTVDTHDSTYSRNIEIENKFDFDQPDLWLTNQALRVINLETFS